jgi:Xaa-Pro aminopeptidase
MLSRYFAVEEYVARKRRVLAEMEKRGCATAVIFGRGAGTHEHHGDLLYLTNYYSSASGQEPDNALLNARSFSAVILRKDADAELHADIPGLREDLVVIDRFEAHYDPIRGVADSLNQRKTDGPVALVGSQFLPMKYWKQLEAETKGVRWQIEDDLVQTVRRIKSPAELKLYREGGQIATRAITRYMEGLIGGKRECDAAADAATAIMREGGGFLMLPSSHGRYTAFCAPIRSTVIARKRHAPGTSCAPGCSGRSTRATTSIPVAPRSPAASRARRRRS